MILQKGPVPGFHHPQATAVRGRHGLGLDQPQASSSRPLLPLGCSQDAILLERQGQEGISGRAAILQPSLAGQFVQAAAQVVLSLSCVGVTGIRGHVGLEGAHGVGVILMGAQSRGQAQEDALPRTAAELVDQGLLQGAVEPVGIHHCELGEVLHPIPDRAGAAMGGEALQESGVLPDGQVPVIGVFPGRGQTVLGLGGQFCRPRCQVLEGLGRLSVEAGCIVHLGQQEQRPVSIKALFREVVAPAFSRMSIAPQPGDGPSEVPLSSIQRAQLAMAGRSRRSPDTGRTPRGRGAGLYELVEESDSRRDASGSTVAYGQPEANGVSQIVIGLGQELLVRPLRLSQRAAVAPGISQAQGGPPSQRRISETLAGSLEGLDGILELATREQVEGHVYQSAVGVGTAGEALLQLPENLAGALPASQDQKDAPGQKQGVAGDLRVGRRRHRQLQQLLGLRGPAVYEVKPGEAILAGEGQGMGGVLAEEDGVGALSALHVIGARVVGGRVEQRLRGKVAGREQLTYLFKGLGRTPVLALFLQAGRALPAGIRGAQVVGVFLVERLVRAHRLATAPATGKGSRQHEPSLGLAWAVGVVADELGKELGRGGVVLGVTEQVAGQTEIVIVWLRPGRQAGDQDC